MEKKVKCLIFKPYEEGIVKNLDFNGMREEIRKGCSIAIGHTNINLGDKYTIYIDDEGLLEKSPYSRGVNGVFVVTLCNDRGYSEDLSDKDIEFIKSKLDKYTKKFNFERNIKELKELENFFNEIELENKIFSYSIENIFISLSVYQIIEMIGYSPEETIKQIFKNIVILNFKNGDLYHYFEFLAKNIAENRAKEMNFFS